MKRTLGAILLAAAFAIPGIAQAATAIATTNVNLRAGPDTGYPVVFVVSSGEQVEVFGCLETADWCDVVVDGSRGWIAASYLAYLENGRQYDYAPRRVGAPVVTFAFGSYWDDHYRGRGFYRERDRYRDRWDRGRYYGDRDGRRDRRYDRRDDRRDDRYDRRDGRRDDRYDRRDGWRDDRDGRRDVRRDDRRDDGRDGRVPDNREVRRPAPPQGPSVEELMRLKSQPLPSVNGGGGGNAPGDRR